MCGRPSPSWPVLLPARADNIARARSAPSFYDFIISRRIPVCVCEEEEPFNPRILALIGINMDAIATYCNVITSNAWVRVKPSLKVVSSRFHSRPVSLPRDNVNNFCEIPPRAPFAICKFAIDILCMSRISVVCRLVCKKIFALLLRSCLELCEWVFYSVR